jgi:hypothetical protein
MSHLVRAPRKQERDRIFNAFDEPSVMFRNAIAVPEELKDRNQIFYQLALGVAGLKVLNDL